VNDDRITPDEALEFAEEMLPLLPPELSDDMPEGFVNFVAGIMVIITEAANGDCTCDTCTRLRELHTALMDSI
jgi:hypothetical protein